MPSAHYPEMSEKLMAVLMAMLVTLMPFSIDAYLPAIPEMAQSLNADVHRIEQSLSLFMFGTGRTHTAFYRRSLPPAAQQPGLASIANRTR
ncbi:integral membrane efflux protein [Neisseria meningitidis]|nr:integral membrane efflux protein [Neisseria meningitidis]